jgi:hypothetical protein
VRVRTLERKLPFSFNKEYESQKVPLKLFGFCSFPMRLYRKTIACGASSRSCFAHRGFLTCFFIKTFTKKLLQCAVKYDTMKENKTPLSGGQNGNIFFIGKQAARTLSQMY